MHILYKTWSWKNSLLCRFVLFRRCPQIVFAIYQTGILITTHQKPRCQCFADKRLCIFCFWWENADGTFDRGRKKTACCRAAVNCCFVCRFNYATLWDPADPNKAWQMCQHRRHVFGERVSIREHWGTDSGQWLASRLKSISIMSYELRLFYQEEKKKRWSNSFWSFPKWNCQSSQPALLTSVFCTIRAWC